MQASHFQIVSANAAPLNRMTVKKYDPNGNLLWTKLDPGENLFSAKVKTDMVGNLFVAGAFITPTSQFGDTILTNCPATISADSLFLAKLNTTTPPSLTIEKGTNAMRLSWSVLASDFYLESKSAFGLNSVWTSNAVPAAVVGLSNVVTAPNVEQRFYRLRRGY